MGSVDIAVDSMVIAFHGIQIPLSRAAIKRMPLQMSAASLGEISCSCSIMP